MNQKKNYVYVTLLSAAVAAICQTATAGAGDVAHYRRRLEDLQDQFGRLQADVHAAGQRGPGMPGRGDRSPSPVRHADSGTSSGSRSSDEGRQLWSFTMPKAPAFLVRGTGDWATKRYSDAGQLVETAVPYNTTLNVGGKEQYSIGHPLPCPYGLRKVGDADFEVVVWAPQVSQAGRPVDGLEFFAANGHFSFPIDLAEGTSFRVQSTAEVAVASVARRYEAADYPLIQVTAWLERAVAGSEALPEGGWAEVPGYLLTDKSWDNVATRIGQSGADLVLAQLAAALNAVAARADGVAQAGGEEAARWLREQAALVQNRYAEIASGGGALAQHQKRYRRALVMPCTGQTNIPYQEVVLRYNIAAGEPDYTADLDGIIEGRLSAEMVNSMRLAKWLTTFWQEIDEVHCDAGNIERVFAQVGRIVEQKLVKNSPFVFKVEGLDQRSKDLHLLRWLLYTLHKAKRKYETCLGGFMVEQGAVAAGRVQEISEQAHEQIAFIDSAEQEVVQWGCLCDPNFMRQSQINFVYLDLLEAYGASRPAERARLAPFMRALVGIAPAQRGVILNV